MSYRIGVASYSKVLKYSYKTLRDRAEGGCIYTHTHIYKYIQLEKAIFFIAMKYRGKDP